MQSFIIFLVVHHFLCLIMKYRNFCKCLNIWEKMLRMKTVIGRERIESCGCAVVVLNHPDRKAEISPNLFAIELLLYS